MKKILLNTIQKTSPNYRKYSALVSDKDFPKINKYRWCVFKCNHTLYAIAWINGKHIFMHNFIMGEGEVDHIKQDGLNNQRRNLRIVSRSQNNMNRLPRKDCSSVYKGVSFFKISKKWHAYINYNRKRVHIGYFLTEKEAGLAYNKMAKKLFGKFAYLNKVNGL